MRSLVGSFPCNVGGLMSSNLGSMLRISGCDFGSVLRVPRGNLSSMSGIVRHRLARICGIVPSVFQVLPNLKRLCIRDTERKRDSKSNSGNLSSCH